VVFGAGLAVLFFLQGDQGARDFENPDVSEIEDPDFDLIPVAAPINEAVDVDSTPPEAAADQQPIAGRAGFRGKIWFVGYDEETGETAFTLAAEDSHTLPNSQLEITDVTVTYPGTGVLVAKRGLVILEQKGALVIQGNLGSHIELDEGVLTLDKEHALAPATFTSPKIEGDLKTQIFQLTGEPRLKSKALLLSGAAIELRLDEHRVKVMQNARADVLDQEGVPARSLAGEVLEVIELDPDHVHMQADGGALLTIITTRTEAPTVSLSAPSIGLSAVRLAPAKTASDEFALTDIQVAGGRGVLEAGDATITGEAFDFEFDERGEAGRVTVTGDPSARFPARLAGDLKLAHVAVDESETITLDSDDELVLTLDRDLEILTRGASTLRFAGLALEAGEGFEGFSDERKHHLHLLGIGGVSLAGTLPPDSAGVTRTIDYVAEELVVNHTALDEGSRVTLDSKGETVLDLKGPSESAHFSTAESLSLVLHNKGGVNAWSIPRASDLDFSLVSDGVRTSGSAAQIQNFEPERFRFDGTEIAFERASVAPQASHDPYALSASGSVLHAHGEDDLTIVGNQANPARFGRAGLNLSARSLVRKGATFTAEGVVHAEVGRGEQLSTFNCKRLVVEGLELDVEMGEWSSAKRLFAEGNVISSAVLAGQRVGLDAESVELLNLGQDKLELHARDQVQLTLDEEGASWSVLADRLDAFGDGTESSPPADGSNWLEVVARGGVVVRESEADFYGRGSALYLERGPDSRVLLEGGDERAWVSSRLPNGAFYKGRVAQLKIANEELVAENLSGEIQGVFLPGDSTEAQASNLEIVCDHFTALVETRAGQVLDVVQLDGNVLLSRKRPDVPRDTLRAQHATFTHERLPGVADAETGTHAFDVMHTSFLAHGQVVLKSGFQFQALGEHLEVAKGSRKLLFEGTPAAITFGGFCTMNTWISFDVDCMGIESGKGFVCQDPAIIKRLTSGEVE